MRTVHRDRVPGKQRPHEGPFVTEHTAAVVPDAVRFDEVRCVPNRTRASIFSGTITYSTTQVIMLQPSGARCAQGRDRHTCGIGQQRDSQPPPQRHVRALRCPAATYIHAVQLPRSPRRRQGVRHPSRARA